MPPISTGTRDGDESERGERQQPRPAPQRKRDADGHRSGGHGGRGQARALSVGGEKRHERDAAEQPGCEPDQAQLSPGRGDDEGEPERRDGAADLGERRHYSGAGRTTTNALSAWRLAETKSVKRPVRSGARIRRSLAGPTPVRPASRQRTVRASVSTGTEKRRPATARKRRCATSR